MPDKPLCVCLHSSSCHGVIVNGKMQVECIIPNCKCTRYFPKNCPCGHEWETHGIIDTQPDKLACPACGKACEHFRREEITGETVNKKEKEPETTVLTKCAGFTDKATINTPKTGMCECEHPLKDHYEVPVNGRTEAGCMKCEAAFDDLPLCKCGHDYEDHLGGVGTIVDSSGSSREEGECNKCWEDPTVKDPCPMYEALDEIDVELASDDFQTVNKTALEQIGKSRVESTVHHPYNSNSNWNDYGYGGGYTPRKVCTHTPYRALANNPKESDGTWEVYVGKKDFVTPYLVEENYDLILNCSNGGSVLPSHSIPTSWGKKYEELKAKEIRLDWPDMGVPVIAHQFWKDLFQHIEKKNSKVLIFCLGGHGRTGTALAALMVAAGWTAADAKQWIWKNYCSEAIETKAQEAYLTRLEEFYKRKKAEKVN